MKNDVQQFIVLANPFMDDNVTLLTYLLTSEYANDIATIGIGENGPSWITIGRCLKITNDKA